MRRPRTVIDTVVADQVGMPLHSVHLLHPAEMGCPRDFEWAANHYNYTAAGIELLARELRSRGQGAAAARCETIISNYSLAVPADKLLCA